MKTIICDIDGTLLFHYGTQNLQLTTEPKIIQGTLEKLHEWDKLGYGLILITGRREGGRAMTENQLRELGISYDQLIMGVGRGPRVLVNDFKQKSDNPTAIALNLKRNTGISNIEV